MTEKLCPSCHRPLPEDAPAGLCPVCVLTAARGSAAPAGLPPLEEVAAAFPQFEILACIGHGGMGVVYRVRHLQLDRLLALKILLPGLHSDPGFVVRFAREAKILAKLDHPNIVTVHDFGESEGLCWLTMEYVEGVNLRQAMQAARFTTEQALAVIPELCSALQYAHDQGILHRDIKPENILLDDAGRVKIVDFGIARLLGDDPARTVLTATGAALGSAAYVAPEQIEQPHLVDHRADLYSLGVIFYEMLTGELPLGRFAPPSRKSGSHPRLDPVVFRTLEKERELRYPSATAMREGLERASRRMPQPPPVPRNMPAPKLSQGDNVEKILSTVFLVVAGLVLALVGTGFLGALTGVTILAFQNEEVQMFSGALIVPVCAAMLMMCWHRLWKARRGLAWASLGVQFISAILPVAVVSMMYVETRQNNVGTLFQGKGDYIFNVADVFTVCLLIGLLPFWLISPSWSRWMRVKWARGFACVAVLAGASALLGAKYYDGHWPFANYYEEVNLSEAIPENLPASGVLLPSSKPVEVQSGSSSGQLRTLQPAAAMQQIEVPATPLSRSLDEAQTAFHNKLFILGTPGRDLRFGVLAPTRRELTQNIRAVLDRLQVTLPTRYASYVPDLLQRYPEFTGRELPRRPVKMHLGILGLAGLAGALSSWCVFQKRWEPLVLFTVGAVIAFVTPLGAVAGFREERLLSEPPPDLPAMTIPVPDFSTPVAAMQSVFDAAAAGDEETVRRGMTQYCLDHSNFGGPDSWHRVVRGLAVRTRAGPAATQDDTSTVTLWRGIKLDRVKVIREGGEWKMKELPPEFVWNP